MADIVVKPTEETVQLTCGNCAAEFAVVLNPDYRALGTDRAMKEGGCEPQAVKFCPFCGEEELET